MKLTKSRLRQIIQEELAEAHRAREGAAGDDGSWYSEEHETVADRKWADNPNRTQDAHGQKAYLVTVGYGSTAVGIFSSMEAAEEGVLRDIESERQEQAGRSRADYGADTTAKREDYNIDEYTLDKGR